MCLPQSRLIGFAQLIDVKPESKAARSLEDWKFANEKPAAAAEGRSLFNRPLKCARFTRQPVNSDASLIIGEYKCPA